MESLIECMIPITGNGISDDLFFVQVIDGIIQSAENNGYKMVLNLLTSKTLQTAECNNCVAEGIILVNSLFDHSIIDRIQSANIPLVVIGSPENRENLFTVDIDTVGAAFQIANYIMAKGHKNIFYINSPSTYAYSRQYCTGFKLAHKENGIPWDDRNCVEHPVTPEAGYFAAEDILKDAPQCSAIITTSEIVAKGVLDRLSVDNKLNRKKLAVVSMGGTPISRLYKPGITTIDFFPKNLGFIAADLLHEVISRKRIRPSHFLLPTKLVERDSA